MDEALLRRAGPAVVGAAWLMLYVPTLGMLVEHWAANDVYSYAFMVPVITAAMLWMKREELSTAGASPALLAGSTLTAAGLLILMAGRASSTNLLEELSLVVTAGGVVLLLFGWSTLRVVAFPLMYLLAMIPLWDSFTSRVHPYFQLYSAAVGVQTLRAFGIPVIRDGFMIDLPHARLEVAEACSGVNYLIAVLCIGVAATYLFVNGWSRRISIVAVSVVVALLSNALRVSSVALFAYYGVRGENGDIHGPFALFRSLLISAIGYAILFALIVRFNGKAGAEGGVLPRLTSESPTVRASRPSSRVIVAAVVALMMLASSAAVMAYHQVAAVPLDVNRSVLPLRIGTWEANGPGVFSRELDLLTFDEKLTRCYRSADGSEMHLLVGHFDRQTQGRELAGYGLRKALGTGERSEFRPSRGSRVDVNELVTRRKSGASYVAYWYTVAGTPVGDELRTKMLTAWNAIVRGRSDGALVLVRTRMKPDEPLEKIRARTAGFIALIASTRPASRP